MQKNNEERKQFFEELYHHCSSDDVYSVIETAESMGISYEQVEKWARNKKLNHILQECRAMCAKRSKERSMLSNTTNYEEHSKYYYYQAENDDEVAKVYLAELKRIRLKEKAEKKAKKMKEEAERKIKEQAKELRKSITFAKYPDSLPQQNDINDRDNLIVAAEPQNQLTQWHEQRESAEEERLNAWREKQATENTGHCVQKNKDKSTDETIYLVPKFDNPDLTVKEKGDISNATLCAATGTASSAAGDMIITSAIVAIHRSNWPDIAHVTTATQDALVAMKPNDIFEGMLCSRLWALHNQAMNYMNRAAQPDATTATIDLNINRATKLMRVHTETLDALNKHRRKGEQRVTVQHVNVSNGGQAIVAAEFTPGGRANEK